MRIFTSRNEACSRPVVVFGLRRAAAGIESAGPTLAELDRSLAQEELRKDAQNEAGPDLGIFWHRFPHYGLR